MTKAKPHVVRISTPGASGTGFLLRRSKDGDLYALATAAHVISEAHLWELPIRLEHHESQEVVLLHHGERAVFIDDETDTAAVVFVADGLSFPDKPFELIPEGRLKKVGVEICWLGFPAVSPDNLCFFSGRISAILRPHSAYLVDGVAINGVSGGPAFALEGNSLQIIGVVAAYIANRATGETLPGLSVVSHVRHLQDLVKKFDSLEEATDSAAEAERERLAQPDKDSNQDA